MTKLLIFLNLKMVRNFRNEDKMKLLYICWLVCRYWAARNTCPKCNYRWTNDLTSSVMNLRKVQPFKGTVPRALVEIRIQTGVKLIRGSVKTVDFPVPSRDVTYQNLFGREKFKYSRPERV
jgi:hypothetical protein